MPPTPLIVERPQRWDASFDPEMAGATVDRVLGCAPFNAMKPENFPKRIALRDIVLHDTRIRRYRKGELVVRQGDHGTSAFLILSGAVRIVLKPGLPPSVLGRRESKRKGIFRVLAQLWSNSNEPESFKISQLKQDARLGARQEGDEVKIFLQDVPRIVNEHKTEVMEPGEFFGEIAALSRMPRTSTIFVESDEAELLEIRWQGLRDLMRYDGGLRAHIDKIYRERALASHLREIPMFRNLQYADLLKVMEQTEFATYGDYDWSGEYKRLAQAGSAGLPTQEPVIVQEDDYPNGVVLIRAGFARVTKKFGRGQRTLNYLGAGQHYGFQEIAHNWRKRDSSVNFQYSLRAIGYTHVLIIPTSVIEQFVLPTLSKRELPPLIETAPDSEADSSIDAGAKIGPDVMEFLTENRFFNGTATMVIDLDRCTRCDDCVRACASTHNNNPRFLRHGPASGKIMIANACMHCADPVCMIGCPTGAIHRESFHGDVVINPATCIGCKACFNNCPYDAIRMVEIRDEQGTILVDHEMKPIIKATKCDLCVEQTGGPACERACPHSALRRMNMNDLDTFVEWLKR